MREETGELEQSNPLYSVRNQHQPKLAPLAFGPTLVELALTSECIS